MGKITSADRVVVRGRYLFYEQEPTKRFLLKGIAFPVPIHDLKHPYDETGWIDILKQLRDASPHINVLRIYQLSLSAKGLDTFYQAAADLGFYLIIPLTDSAGDGVLDRDLPAPECYSRNLYHFGTRVIDAAASHPNILGGVLGNEVMNSLEHWKAAPCVLAYARDLKAYAPNFTLMYTTQHDGIGAVLTPAKVAQLLLNYFTCESSNISSIDILGINIESWCSSLQTFERNEDGSLGTYLDLYHHLQNSAIPIIFSELGCSQTLFNRDNGLPGRGVRDWKQIPVILNETMAQVWSGFVAYAYDGPPDFAMTTGGPWDGTHILEFNQDMINFLNQLAGEEGKQATFGTAGTDKSISIQWSSEATYKHNFPNRTTATCSSVQETLQECCKLNLLPEERIPSYANPESFTATAATGLFFWGTVLCAILGTQRVYIQRRQRRAANTDTSLVVMGENPSKGYHTF